MSYVTLGFSHIQFDMKVTGAETWQGPRSRSETVLISASPPVRSSPPEQSSVQ